MVLVASPSPPHPSNKGKGVRRLSGEEPPKLPESLANSKRAMESFDDFPFDEDTANDLVEYYPNWLDAMEINTYRNVAMLKHVQLNFDESITRKRKSQTSKEAERRRRLSG